MMNCFCTAKITGDGHQKPCTFKFKMAAPALMVKTRWKDNKNRIISVGLVFAPFFAPVCFRFESGLLCWS